MLDMQNELNLRVSLLET